MKKLTIIFAAIAIFFTSCIKVSVDNSSTGGEGGGGSDQDEIIRTGVLTGTIETSVTLPRGKYTLRGYVFVAGGSTLTFAPGTIIVSDSVQKGALIIEKNAKLFAEGTATQPIIFTSGRPPATRQPGDWGGIVLLGNAPTNRATPPVIEGGINRTYGGNVPNDNSGALRYVRIEFAGIAADPNSEINSLTMGGVGSATVIEYIQTSYGNDDSYEFFGGVNNARYLVAYATADDDFDFDFGFRGNLQFGIALRDPSFVDPGDAANGVECDNDGTGTNAQPITKPTLSNFTWVGPNNQPASNGQVLTRHNFNMRWRRATQFETHNSILMCYNLGGFAIESDSTGQAYKDGRSLFRNNLVHAVRDPYLIGTATGGVPTVRPEIITAPQMRTLAESQGCITFTDHTAIGLTAPLNLTAPNFTPITGSPALSGASFVGLGSFFTPTTHRGAVGLGATNWLSGWTSFTPKTNVY
jgi:hypothetical protein